MIANDAQQKVCIGPVCECAGTEEECGCRQITNGVYDETLDRCSDCGVKLKERTFTRSTRSFEMADEFKYYVPFLMTTSVPAVVRSGSEYVSTKLRVDSEEGVRFLQSTIAARQGVPASHITILDWKILEGA